MRIAYTRRTGAHRIVMSAGFTRALHALAFALGLGTLLLAPRDHAQAAVPVRHTVAISHYYFERIGANDGLQQSGVSSIYQDAEGFIWIAAPSGLYRFDGHHLLAFLDAARRRHGSSAAAITGIAGAGDGRLWLSTGALTDSTRPGLLLFDPGHGLLPLPAGLHAPGPGATLLTVPGARLLMAGPAGVSLWDGRQSRLHVLWQAPAGAEGVHALSTCSATTAYALADGNLLRVNVVQPAVTALALPDNVTGSGQALLCTPRGQLLLGTRAGLFAQTADGWSRLWPEVGAAPAGVGALAEDASGALWIAPDDGGLLRLAGDLVQRVPARHGVRGDLPPGVLRQLLISRDGSLWAIAGMAGVVHTDSRGARFQSVTVPDRNDPEDRANFIRALAPAGASKLWVGSHAGLMLYDARSQTLNDYTPLLLPALHGSAPRIQPLTASAMSGLAVEGIVREPRSGKLWLATSAGLLQFDPATGVTQLAYASDPGNPVPGQWLYTVWQAPDGTLWLAGAVRGVARWRPGMAAPQWLPPPPGNAQFPHAFGFAAADLGGVWIATNGDLLLWQHDRLRAFRHQPGQADSLSNNEVISLARGAGGTLWVGTGDGLDHLLGVRGGQARFQHYGLRQGLPDNVIYCLVEQPHGTLWIGTNLGIAALDTASGRVVRYGQRDGINGMESNAGTCARMDDGSIAFGGPEGFAIGAALRKQPDAPDNVQLTAMRVGDEGERVPPRTGSLRVALGQSVRIRFASLDYRHPAAGLYRYRLLGRSTRWSAPAPTRGVSYADLDAGRYTFEVAASTGAGAMLAPPARLSLSVVPPWWDSPAMRALYALLAGGVVLLLIGMTWNRRRTERRYRLDSAAREERLKLALWGSGDALWELDLQRGVLSRMGDLHLLGGPREDVLTIEDWRRYAVHPDDLPQLEHNLAEHLAGHTPFYESEHRLRGADGQWIWIRARGKISESDAEGHPLRVIGTSRDISSELARARELSISDLVVRSMGEAVAVTDATMHFVAVNPAFTRMTGYTAQDILGRPSSLLDSPDQPEAFLQVRAKLESSGHFHGELWQRKRDGEPILCRIEINEIRDGHGQRTHFVAVLTDVTARRRAEQELHYLANYDPLTGLPNRTLLTERLGDAILRARQMGRLVAVLFVDLDRFKHVNDAHGHNVGDRALQAAGRRLRAGVRDDDTVARLGGDEFTVVLERVAQTSDAEDIAQKLLEMFTEPMDLGDGREAQISLSIGIALYPTHGQAPTDLLKYADIAMYRAKERGRNTFAVYTEALDTEVRQRADLIAALQRALKREELHLVYQPKLSLAEDRITGVEALLRWHSEEFGSIPPSLFIPLAEEIGLISTIGEFVIERACAELATWCATGLKDVTMAVNLSAAQLARGDISNYLFETLARHAIAPELLELELTESMLMQDPERARAILEAINNVGVTLAIDDFGTGYSSLAYLQRLPLDTLKIDQTFVSKLTLSVDDETILGTIVLMAHALGLNVVAEGVETTEQLEYLREKDCDEVQGYLLAQPMPGPACLAFIQQHRAQRALAHD